MRQPVFLIHVEIAGKLTSRKPLLRVENERQGQEPLLKGKMGMMKNRADRHAERRVAGIAVVTLFLGKAPMFEPNRSTGKSEFLASAHAQGERCNRLLSGKVHRF